MNRMLATTTLSAAIALALATPNIPVRAQAQGQPPEVVRQNMERMAKNKLEKCYGISLRGKNDCAEGAHSCAGQATADRDKASFVLLPAGDCSKIAGASLRPS